MIIIKHNYLLTKITINYADYTVCKLLNIMLSAVRSVQLILVPFKFTDTLLIDSWEIRSFLTTVPVRLLICCCLSRKRR